MDLHSSCWVIVLDAVLLMCNQLGYNRLTTCFCCRDEVQVEIQVAGEREALQVVRSWLTLPVALPVAFTFALSLPLTTQEAAQGQI